VTLFSVRSSSHWGSWCHTDILNSTHNHTVRALAWQEAELRFTSDAKPKWFKQSEGVHSPRSTSELNLTLEIALFIRKNHALRAWSLHAGFSSSTRKSLENHVIYVTYRMLYHT